MLAFYVLPLMWVQTMRSCWMTSYIYKTIFSNLDRLSIGSRNWITSRTNGSLVNLHDVDLWSGRRTTSWSAWLLIWSIGKSYKIIYIFLHKHLRGRQREGEEKTHKGLLEYFVEIQTSRRLSWNTLLKFKLVDDLHKHTWINHMWPINHTWINHMWRINQPFGVEGYVIKGMLLTVIFVPCVTYIICYTTIKKQSK